MEIETKPKKEMIMIPYCVRNGDVSTEEITLLTKVREMVEKLPDLDLGKDENGNPIVVSCHILARAIGKIFELKVIDGYFYPSYQHSWLLTKEGNIIDVYPVAIVGGPLLVVGRKLHPTPSNFQYKKKRISIGTKTKSFIRSVKILFNELKKGQ